MTSEREKRRAARDRARRRARDRDRRGKARHRGSVQQSARKEEVAPDSVYLVDGSAKSKRYDAYWHVFHLNSRVGRARLTEVTVGPDEGASITVEINQSARGRGIGSLAFRLACEHSSYDVVWGIARKSNLASHGAMRRAGFEQVQDTDAGEACFEWRRSPISRLVDDSELLPEPERPFPDHEAEGDDTGSRITLHSRHGCRQDEDAAEVASKLFGIKATEMSSFFRLRHSAGRTWGFSLVHSWALVALSHHVWQGGDLPRICVHIDDHTDMGACKVSRGEEGLLGRGGTPLDLGAPTTVKEHLFRGTFNKGSFMTPWIAAACETEIMHVSWSHPARAESGRLRYAADGVCPVPSVAESESASCSYVYRVASTLLAEPGPEPVWLDIDLDAFCNRLNGDSDRCGQEGAPNELAEAQRRLESVLQQLTNGGWLGQVSLVTIAVSPGFCPAEHWREILCRLVEGLGAPRDLVSDRRFCD